MLSPDHHGRKLEQPFMSSSHWLLQAPISPVSQKTWTLGINISHDSKLVFYAQSTSAVISGDTSHMNKYTISVTINTHNRIAFM